MIHHLVLRLILALVGGGCVYHLVSVFAAVRFARRGTGGAAYTPPVSVLKPVRGVDPGAYDNYASFCLQEYPDYELIFGVQDPLDPGVELIERLRREFPDRSIRLVISGEQVGPNLKVCNLHNMLSQASHELLVISDSDMRVRPEYLRQIASYFQDPKVGLVTSPYRGAGAASLPAGLEALGMATEFFPGVAVASQLAPPAFALGSTLALRRDTLEAVGGLADVAQYLADDFQLGYRVARRGLRVVLSRYVVETMLPNSGFRKMFARRLRWMRTARTCQPAGFAGSIVTHSTVWAMLLVFLGDGQSWAIQVLLFQQGLRWLAALLIGAAVLRCGEVRRWFWLLPVSDTLNFALWVGSWCGSTVQWRGIRYRLTGGGRMERIGPAAPRRVAPARRAR